MNILQLVPKLEVGGVERGTVDLAKYLKRQGHKPVVVSGGGAMVKALDEAGIRHYALPVGEKSALSMISCAARLVKIIRVENIDIVHARSRVPGLIGFIASRATGRIFITTAHGYYNKGVFSRVMSWGRFVVVASGDMARHMKEDFGVPRERIRLIPRGVDLAEFAFRDPGYLSRAKGRKIAIGMIARITPLKGHQDFIKAVSLVYREIPGIRALIVGEAPNSKRHYKEEVAALVRRSGLSGVVEMLGSRRDIPEILSGLDMLVLPTTTPEAFGRVLIEAQACGVPVIATRVGGIVDIIRHGENGLLCQPKDPRSLADAMMKVITDRRLGAEMAVRARKIVEERYTLERMAESTVKAYDEALKRKHVLIIKMSAIGDVILATPSIREVRRQFPDAVITILTSSAAARALHGCPYIDKMIIYDPKGKDRGFKCFRRVVSDLLKEDIDMAIDLQNSRLSHISAFICGARERYGYDNGKWGALLNHRVKGAKARIDPVAHQFKVLEAAGVRPADKRLELWPSAEDEKWADEFLRGNWMNESQRLVGVNVGASPKWSSKRWAATSFAEMCDLLGKRYNARAVLTGSRDDAWLSEDILSSSKSKPMSAVGRTDLLQLAALIKRCDVYVTGDSAPMHVATAVGTPFVAMFGPTDPERHAAKTEKSVILKADAKCSPCYRPVCQKDVSCINRIKVDDVLTAAERYLR